MLCVFMLLDIYKRKAPVLRLLLGVWLAAFLIGEITARGSGLLPQEQKSTGVLELFFGQRIQDVIAAFDYAVIMLLLSAFLLTIRCPPLLTLPWPPLSLPLRTRGATPCRPHCGSCGSRQETSSRSSTRAPPTSPR